MKLLNVAEVGAEMKTYFAGDVLAACQQNGHFEDYCKIGALLTDEETCKSHLLALNEALKNAAPPASRKADVPLFKEQKGQVKSKSASGKDLYSEFVDWTRNDDSKVYHRKFNGLLTSVLQKQEEFYSFNGAIPAAAPAAIPAAAAAAVPAAVPAAPPQGKRTTLTGFVQPDNFKKLLLAQGLHWKDPGARLTHGEFTHRIQWWIIMSEYNKQVNTKYRLTNQLLPLYTNLPQYEMNTGDGKVMWDFLFDCFNNQKPQSDAFRTPDVLHGYLLNGTNPRLDLLGAVIRARQNKRLFMENRAVAGNAYEAYITWKIQTRQQYDTQHADQRVVYKKP